MSSEFCVNHPERPYIEKCEVCGDRLCGYCLYYTEDGQRLCEKHALVARANGLRIIPPAVYAQGIIPAQASASNQGEARKLKGAVEPNQPTFEGNNQDLGGFLAMILGLFTVASCCGGTYCLPFVAVILGILTLTNAKNAVDPARTRRHAWIGIAAGGVFMLIIAAMCAFYVSIFAAGFGAANSSSYYYTPYAFPTDTVTVAPSPTPPANIEPRQLTATAKATGIQ